MTKLRYKHKQSLPYTPLLACMMYVWQVGKWAVHILLECFLLCRLFHDVSQSHTIHYNSILCLILSFLLSRIHSTSFLIFGQKLMDVLDNAAEKGLINHGVIDDLLRT